MRKTLLTIALAMFAAASSAQELQNLLQSVESSNKNLESIRSSNEAAVLDAKIANQLSDPTVEYSPFWHRSTSGLYSSELIVEQEFDFPTLYASRSKAGRLQAEAADQEYLLARRDLLLEAKQLYLDLVHNHKTLTLLEERSSRADSIAALTERMEEMRQSTILDLSKARMELMTIKGRLEQARSQEKEIREALKSLTGGQEVSLLANEWPMASPIPSDVEALVEQISSSDQQVQAAQAQVRLQEQNVKIQKQSVLPKLSVGYRRNTDEHIASNGFLVSTSIPLFSSRNKAKQAKSILSSTLSQQEQAAIDAEQKTRSLIAEAQSLERTLASYDEQLMKDALQALEKSRSLGQISVLDYFREADQIWDSIEELESLRLDYHKALSEIYRNEL